MSSVFPDLVKDCPKIRNLPKIFLISFENVAPGLLLSLKRITTCEMLQSLTNNVNGLRQLRSLPTTADINIIRT